MAIGSNPSIVSNEISVKVFFNGYIAEKFVRV